MNNKILINLKQLEEFIEELKNLNENMHSNNDYKEGYRAALESIDNYLIGVKEVIKAGLI